MPYINGMIVQSDGSKPHVVFIMEILARQFPNIIWKIGGFKDRLTSEGHESAHASGRACDIYLDATDALDRTFGDLLFALFSNNAVDLKVDHTIWNSHIWSQASGGPTYFTEGNGGPHRDHVHVAFIDDDLGTKPLKIVELCKRLNELYSSLHNGEGDRVDGIYGKAFDPKHPNVRLTSKQRRAIMLRKMGLPKGF